MDRDSRGWKLLSYRIDGVLSHEENKVTLRITFTEAPPPEHLKRHLPSGVAIDELEIEDDSVWVVENGTWYSYSPGERGYLGMNSPIVVNTH
jgi:hypothetical protein